jgi:phenylacetate-CoA ligase
MRSLREWERLDVPSFERLHAVRLQQTLAYAQSRIPLYASARWREASASNLRSWPQLEREVVQRRGPELLAPSPARRLTYRSTSGSTGRPLRVALDPAADAWSRANIFRTMLWFGVQPGAKRLMLSASGDSPLLNWLRNVKAFSARDLSPERLRTALDYLVRERPAYVWGLPSAIVELARMAREASAPPLPLVPFVRVYGEMLFPFQREEIEAGLGGRIVETYGCEEIGMIAHACPAGSMHVLDEHVHVEILREGQPVAPGESGEVVVTVLTNRAMPLIRYRLGDRAKLFRERCPCGRPHPVLSDLQGRVGDVLPAADGTPVHGNVLGYGLRDVLANVPRGAVGQVLYEQRDPLTWRILVKAGPGFDEHIVARLIETVRGPFGARCRVSVEEVGSIPREPSGKFRYYRSAAGGAEHAQVPAADQEA